MELKKVQHALLKLLRSEIYTSVYNSVTNFVEFYNSTSRKFPMNHNCRQKIKKTKCEIELWVKETLERNQQSRLQPEL